MWLSKNITNTQNEYSASLGEISATKNEAVSVLDDIDHKELSVIVPYGIYYKAPLEEKCVLIPTESDKFCAGVIMKNKSLSSGDLLLSTGTTGSILIRANGDIEINGNVKINGVVQ